MRITNMSEGVAKQGLLEKFIPSLLLITVALAFVVGVLWQKVTSLEGGTGTKVEAVDNTAPEALGDADGKLTEDEASKLAKASKDDHIRGSLDAEVFLIEYSDLECPYCSSFHATAKEAVAEYGDKLAWVYRHFPLDTIHPRARPAAIASECVFNLGGDTAFWKFADTIFASQETTLTDEGLKTSAASSGVNSASFTTCYEAKSTEAKVDAQLESGSAAGVTGTPGNFVMNKKGEVWIVPGAVPFSSLKPIIDKALAS